MLGLSGLLCVGLLHGAGLWVNACGCAFKVVCVPLSVKLYACFCVWCYSVCVSHSPSLQQSCL